MSTSGTTTSDGSDDGSTHPGATGPDPLSAEMGVRIREAWEDGTLVLPLRSVTAPVRLPGLHEHGLPAGLAGPATVRLAGVGERFAAWKVEPEQGGALIVRVPHVGPEDLAQGLAQETAALTLLPPHIGPDPIAFHDDAATSPLGQPYVCSSFLSGEILSPQDWTGEHLAAHARQLAQLHSVSAPGRGSLQLGADPWRAVDESPDSLVDEVQEQARIWHERAGDELDELDLGRFLDAAVDRVSAAAPLFRELRCMSLVHGDLCVTNVLWPADGDPGRPSFIDFEWAQADDPARDLTIIGGSVHGGPWYVPMDDSEVEAFVGEYARARRELGAHDPAVTDPSALRERMRAWIAYERTAMLMHVARLAPGSARHRDILPTLRGTLARELGITL